LVAKVGYFTAELAARIRRWAARTQELQAVPEPEAAVPEPQAVNAEEVKRLLALCGDGRAVQILSVARNEAKSVDDRMRALVELDPRHDGFKSKQWAELLNVTEGAVRQAPFWKDREKRKEWAQ
jgi:hypothetical protein